MDRFVQFEQQMRWSKLNEVLRSIDDDIMVKIMLWCSQQSQAICFCQLLKEIIWTASVNDFTRERSSQSFMQRNLKENPFSSKGLETSIVNMKPVTGIVLMHIQTNNEKKKTNH